jgi:hypothetical protein
MEKFKGTGGEWFFRIVRQDGIRIISIRRDENNFDKGEDRNDLVIAGIWDTSEQSLANARLMVASKALLQFAQAVFKNYSYIEWVKKEGERVITKALEGEDEARED